MDQIAKQHLLKTTDWAMQLVVHKSPEEASLRIADILVDEIRKKPDSLICVAAGQSPTRTYQLLSEHALGEADLFRRVRILKLDEWIGPSMFDHSTCEYYIQKNLIRPLALRAEQVVAFKSDHAEPHIECARVRDWIEENGPIDICLLGLGLNGHIGLNEPGTEATEHSHVALLADTTLGHSMLNNVRSLPKRGYTVGLAEILASRRIFLLVFGRQKAQVLEKLVSSRATPEFPASYLLTTRDAVCHCDQAAARFVQTGRK